MRIIAAVFASVSVLFSVPSFADNNVLLSTGLGAAMGAVVGHQISHDNGAWVGGALGAVTGAAIASSNNNTRYVQRDAYGYSNNYNTYNAPRRDIYVVEQDYYQRPYQRPPVNVIVVDNDRGHGKRRGHHHERHHERHHGGGQGYYNQGRNDGRTVVIVR